jgi:DoxX-like protein
MNGSSSTRANATVLLPVSDLATAKAVSIAYWICTALTAFLIASGGLAYALAVPDVVEGVIQLGFPLYFVQLLGIWKVLGGLALLAPGLPRLKEWAYAGILFDLTGAAVANATMGASIGAEWWHVPAPLFVAVILVGSWALRPASRRLPGPAL